MQINLKKKRQLGRDKREFEPMASALAWKKALTTDNEDPYIGSMNIFTANIINKIKQANNWTMP